MATKRPTLPTPKFGATVTNLVASESNPTRTGYFVRFGYRSGRMNAGPWWEVTDGRGEFWQLDPVTGRLPHLFGNGPHLIVDRSTEMPPKPGDVVEREEHASCAWCEVTVTRRTPDGAWFHDRPHTLDTGPHTPEPRIRRKDDGRG